MEENSMLNMQPLSAVPRQRTNKCDTCTKTFRRRDDYDRHQFLHAGVYTYPCQEKNCCKTFTNRSHLLRHMQTKHLERSSASSPKVWNCEHPNCTMQFARKHAMKRHYNVKHTLGKQYVCDLCSERFWRKLQLKQHMIHHTGQYPHKCEPCGQGFINLKSMRDHRCQRNSYKCTNCSIMFVRWLELVTHQRLEHAKQFRCEECNKLLRTKRNLKAHAQVHLAEDVQEVYECPYAGCTRFYTYKRNLNIHVRSKHRSTKSEE
ncbi:zinc finger protein 726-like [Anopheles funestus]|uniref:zinc finger protein 726-like n=1 Tax=Anopheles funestus TaxID=62324 RepID=UPI0020C5D7F4|nr:zinc finger protein 726-like [Anopheles funestus]